MTMHQMLTEMSSVELSQRIALNNIRVREQKDRERIAKAKRNRR